MSSDIKSRVITGFCSLVIFVCVVNIIFGIGNYATMPQVQGVAGFFSLLVQILISVIIGAAACYVFARFSIKLDRESDAAHNSQSDSDIS